MSDNSAIYMIGYSTPELAQMGMEFGTGVQKNRGMAVAIIAVLACLPETANIDKNRAYQVVKAMLREDDLQSWSHQESFNTIERIIGFAEQLKSGKGHLTVNPA
jgi:hypothetical protein